VDFVRNPFNSPLWGNRAFVRVWSASTISVFGSLITRLALPFVAILVLGAGPIEVALLRGLEIGTGLFVGLVVGAWVDRLRRRPILIWADLGRAVLLASIPIAFAAGGLTLWQVLAVTALASILTTFFDAADNAYLPTVVERERLVEANSALTASWSASEFAGFSIAGFLISVLTAPIAIVIDAITFVVSALLLVGIRAPEPPPPPPSAREPVRAEIAEGIRVVRGSPILRAFLLAQMLHHALWGVFGAIWILFAVDYLALGPAAIGFIAAAGGIASFVGAVVAQRSIGRWGFGPVAIAAMVIFSIGNAFIPLAPASLPLVAVGCLLIQQLVGDGAATVFEIAETTVRQTLVPDRQLGRVTSTFFVTGHAAQLAATLGAGLLAEVIGLRATLVFAPLAGMVGAIILWRSPVRTLIRLEGDRSVDEDAVAREVLAETGRSEPVGG
jgi:MFS family permease